MTEPDDTAALAVLAFELGLLPDPDPQTLAASIRAAEQAFADHHSRSDCGHGHRLEAL